MTISSEIILNKEFPSILENIPKLHSLVSEKISKFLPNEKLDTITLAISEAISNAIKHGNKADPNKKITITVIISKDKITIKIKDEGGGFKLNTIPNPTEKENLLKESGRGIFIIKNVVDNLQYNFTDTGTETILEINR